MMKSTFLIFLACVGLSCTLFGQQYNTAVSAQRSTPNLSRVTFGGSFGVGFTGGNGGGGSISVAPRVGYRVSEDLEVGLLASLAWIKQFGYRSTLMGVGPFANYFILPQLFLGARYEHYFYKLKDTYYKNAISGNEAALYLGGGYQQRIGNTTYLQMGLMYNVLFKENSSMLRSAFIPSVGIVTHL